MRGGGRLGCIRCCKLEFFGCFSMRLRTRRGCTNRRVSPRPDELIPQTKGDSDGSLLSSLPATPTLLPRTLSVLRCRTIKIPPVAVYCAVSPAFPRRCSPPHLSHLRPSRLPPPLHPRLLSKLVFLCGARCERWLISLSGTAGSATRETRGRGSAGSMPVIVRSRRMWLQVFLCPSERRVLANARYSVFTSGSSSPTRGTREWRHTVVRPSLPRLC